MPKYIDLGTPLGPEIQFKIATTQSELEQSYELLFENYYQNGLIKASKSKLHLNYYNLLPQMSTLIALQGNRVIGTIGVINNKLIILSDQMDHHKEVHSTPGNKTAQVLDLAIRMGDEYIPTSLKFYLMKFAYEYCKDYLQVENIIIATNKKSVSYFKYGFGFTELTDRKVLPPQNPDASNQSNLISLTLNLKDFYDHLAINFGRYKSYKNLFKFFTKLNMQGSFIFPRRNFYSALDPVMTPKLLEHFFTIKSDLLSNLTMEQYEYLKYLYDSKEFMDLIPKEVAKLSYISFRRGKRFPVNCRGIIVGDSSVNIDINNVSPNGFSAQIQTPPNMAIGEHFDVSILIGEYNISNIKAKLVWQKSANEFGFSLIKTSPNWTDFIEHLKDKYKTNTLSNPQGEGSRSKIS